MVDSFHLDIKFRNLFIIKLIKSCFISEVLKTVKNNTKNHRKRRKAVNSLYFNILILIFIFFKHSIVFLQKLIFRIKVNERHLLC